MGVNMLIRVLLIYVLSCSMAYAEIRQTDDLELIKREVFASPKDTLVVFDVDFVLITPNDNVFLMTATEEGQKFQAIIYDDLWSRLPVHELDELHTTIMTTQPWRQVTPDTASIFNKIKAKGYKVLGLTASGTGRIGIISSMEEWRVAQLKDVGIAFDASFVNAKAGSLDSYIPKISEHYSKSKHPSFPTAKDGVIFTTYVPKGEVLGAYLQFARIKPRKLIFIDDRLHNLESVQDYCQKFGIAFVGYEYTAIKEQVKDLKLNKRRAKLQYQILETTKTWLNDAQADMLLARIDE